MKVIRQDHAARLVVCDLPFRQAARPQRGRNGAWGGAFLSPGDGGQPEECPRQFEQGATTMNAKGFLAMPIALKGDTRHCHALQNLEEFRS